MLRTYSVFIFLSVVLYDCFALRGSVYFDVREYTSCYLSGCLRNSCVYILVWDVLYLMCMSSMMLCLLYYLMSINDLYFILSEVLFLFIMMSSSSVIILLCEVLCLLCMPSVVSMFTLLFDICNIVYLFCLRCWMFYDLQYLSVGYLW